MLRFARLLSELISCVSINWPTISGENKAAEQISDAAFFQFLRDGLLDGWQNHAQEEH